MQKKSEDNWDRFLKLCSKLKTTKEFDELFDLFLTIEERQAVGNRLRIVEELLIGEKNQRQIAIDCGVGIATITRGSNYLKTISKKLRHFLEGKLL